MAMETGSFELDRTKYGNAFAFQFTAWTDPPPDTFIPYTDTAAMGGSFATAFVLDGFVNVV